jgi:ubiquinone/menaquinone biosynthesis C-methylase UbiE
MACHGGFALDETTRRTWYNPEAILQNLRSGMIFADVGCGDGFFTILGAKKVGERGKAYAVDVDASAIHKLNNKAKAQGLKNIIAKIGIAEKTVFCSKCVDFVFFSMVLHDFADPGKVLQNARQMIRTDGWLIDLDWKKQEMPFGPPVEIRFSEEQASDLIKNTGFHISNVQDVGRYHYLVTCKTFALAKISFALQ